MLAVEFASTLRKLHARGIVITSERHAQWEAFSNLPIEFAWDLRWIDRAMAIAEAAGLSKIYDSIYLACDEAFGFELLTCDARFARAARPVTTAPIRLVEPR